MRAVSPPRMRAAVPASLTKGQTDVTISNGGGLLDPDAVTAMAIVHKANDIARFFSPYSSVERNRPEYNIAFKQFRSILEVVRACGSKGLLWFDLNDDPDMVRQRGMLHIPPDVGIPETKIKQYREWERGVIQKYSNDEDVENEGASIATYVMLWPIREVMTEPYLYCITTNMMYHYLMGLSTYMRIKSEELPRLLRSASSLHHILDPLLARSLLTDQPLVFQMGDVVPDYTDSDAPLHLASNAPLPFSMGYATYWKRFRKSIEQYRQ